MTDDLFRNTFFSPTGEPCTMEELQKFMDTDKRVASDYVVRPDGVRLWVSTVYLGINHAPMGGPPLIFETMAFRVGPNFGQWPDEEPLSWNEEYCQRYSTLEQAQLGHVQACMILGEKEGGYA